MAAVEINFDGIIGPSHNYAGLSLGNIAATANAGPGLLSARGGAAGRRSRCGTISGSASPRACSRPIPAPTAPGSPSSAPMSKTRRRRCAPLRFSASAMWAANAATVSPAPDTADGRCHLTAANLRTMAHRSHEWPATLAQLRLAFADEAHFAVHPPVPGDVRRRRRGQSYAAVAAAMESRASRSSSMGRAAAPSRSASMRKRAGRSPGSTASTPGAPCSSASRKQRSPPAPSTTTSSRSPTRMSCSRTSRPSRIATACTPTLRRLMPEVEIVEVPAARVSLADAVGSYLFNAQLVTLPSTAEWR